MTSTQQAPPAPPVARGDSVSRTRYRLPPPELVPSKAVAEALEGYRSLQARAASAAAKLRELEAAGRKAAEAKDNQALADAIRAGQRDPGPKAVQAWEKQVTEARRVRQALTIALNDEASALEAAVAAHRAELENALRGQMAAAQQAAATALDEFARAAGELQASRATLSWLRGFPRGLGFLDTRGDLRPHVVNNPNLAQTLEGLRAAIDEGSHR